MTHSIVQSFSYAVQAVVAPSTYDIYVQYKGYFLYLFFFSVNLYCIFFSLTEGRQSGPGSLQLTTDSWSSSSHHGELIYSIKI